MFQMLATCSRKVSLKNTVSTNSRFPWQMFIVMHFLLNIHCSSLFAKCGNQCVRDLCTNTNETYDKSTLNKNKPIDCVHVMLI